MGVVRAVRAVRMVSALDVPCLNDEALALARLAQLERGAVGGASGYVGGPGVDCEREGRTGDVRLATGDGELVLATAARCSLWRAPWRHTVCPCACEYYRVE